jgi:chromosome segregation protein
MFLKKVEIFGFKSFANKTTLEFLPARNASRSDAGGPTSVDFDDDSKCRGITAIVGPNGSGKSNVADAIRWVMGEQSMKNLRSKKSEDIIFAGSGKKARLGSAWVTLHLDNKDKKIPLEFSEVTITRKIFRSGESEYLINDSRVRLLDVVDLLAKAGIGRESYCVINQGMSDEVLNATPAERKMVLEDAAGVKQYQIQKERSIRKMDSTRENLDRAGDLIKEIEPHLKMLKRQAEKAQKSKEVLETLKEKQIKLFSYLWHTFQKEKENFSQEKNDVGAKMMNVQRDVDKITDELNKESKHSQNSEKQDELEKNREELRRKLNELEKESIIIEGRKEIEKEKMASQEIIQSIPVDLKYVKEKLQKIQVDQEALIARLQNVKNLEELQEIKEFAKSIKQRLFELYEDAGKGKIEIKEVKNEVSGGVIEKFEKRSQEIEVEIQKIKSEIEKISQDISAEIAEERKMRQRFFELEREMHVKQNELNKFRDLFNDAKIKLAKVEVREEDLTNEIRNELKMDVKDLKFDGQEINREELERETYKLKLQVEQIGGIDPLVVEEYDETRKRYEFLTKESEDLEKAILSLKEVIKEMDGKIGEVFEKAFDEIDKEFTKYFRIIFGGGNARLIKLKIKNKKLKYQEENIDGENDGENLPSEISQSESDEVAISQGEREEIGIDISACPPGKKISHLSMLSGGERSLTSLALLFAIIAYNPPPFAILDEVEAALDEANSRRFSRILQELSAQTQFIAITHNRETMRQASLLYGVTMGEDGISKLLSIKLDQVGQGGKIVK